MTKLDDLNLMNKPLPPGLVEAIEAATGEGPGSSGIKPCTDCKAKIGFATIHKQDDSDKDIK